MRTALTRILGIGLLWPAVASAQAVGDFSISPDIVLAANSNGTGYMVNGVGAPAVAWDPNFNRYLMVFEVKLPIVDADCPYGVWGLGIAYSTTGASTGWVTSPTPLIEPVKGTYYGCVAANPSVMFNPSTGVLNVWFKAEQTDPPDAAIGPSRFTGVGRARVKFRPAGGIASVTVDAAPAAVIERVFGMPRVVRSGGQYEFAVQIYPDIWMGSGATASAMTLDATPVLTADPLLNPAWAPDEMFNPALVCEDDPLYPYTMYVGGRDLGAAAAILTGGWGKAISSDTISWFLGVDAYFNWAGSNEWRHWDVLRVDDPAGPEHLVWYSEKDANGLNQIRFASTTSVWNTADIYDKDCP